MILLRLFRNFRGTTLAAPCLWVILSAASLALLAAVEAARPTSTLGLDTLRFAIAATTLCPVMAVLGAKRPQDRGWQWIVLSLWVVVVWPAAQAVILPTGTHVELFIAWKLFLLGLVAIGLLNYLPTRFWLSSFLVAVGQLILFDSYLWRWNFHPSSLTLPLAVACFLAATIVATLHSWRNSTSPCPADSPSLDTYQQQWHTFRDAYGAFWALRILARVNETAALRHWPIRLTWIGFVPHPSNATNTVTTNQLAELSQAMSTHLRRFNKP